VIEQSGDTVRIEVDDARLSSYPKGTGTHPTVNKLRDRQPLKAVINRNRGG
jgi:hypothetical protein